MIDEMKDFLVENEMIPDYSEDFLSAYYDTLYYIKYLSSNGLINIDRIIESKKDEYDEILKDEFKEVGIPFFVHSFKDKYREMFEYAKKLNLKDYDSDMNNFADYTDDYLNSIVNYKDCNKILSIFGCIRSDNISSKTSVDVLYEEHQSGDMHLEELRCKILGLDNYSFTQSSFPRHFEEKYDFVYLDCVYGFELLDKFYLQEGEYFSSKYYEIINSILECLNVYKKAVIRIPFARISNIGEDVIKDNVIEKIIYLNKRKGYYESSEGEIIDTYIVLNEYKDNDSIEFINTINDKSLIVSNDEILKNNCNLNMMTYYKNSGYVKYIYKIKNNSDKILEQIQTKTIQINKLLDEYDIDKK